MHKTELLLSPFEMALLSELRGSEVESADDVLTTLLKPKRWSHLLCLRSYSIDEVKMGLNSIALKYMAYSEFYGIFRMNVFRPYNLVLYENKLRQIDSKYNFQVTFTSSDYNYNELPGKVLNMDRKLGLFNLEWTDGFIIKNIYVNELLLLYVYLPSLQDGKTRRLDLQWLYNKYQLNQSWDYIAEQYAEGQRVLAKTNEIIDLMPNRREWDDISVQGDTGEGHNFIL